MRSIIFLIILLNSFGTIGAQTKDSLLNGYFTSDTVIVHAFRSITKWKQAAAAVSMLTEKEIGFAGAGNLLPALNAVSGVRMEERSPGSYRLSIRGSLLRSPFGVRNVKVYWNGFPLSDGGGNTYLNLVDLQQISSVEILKGPSGSMFGSGTGGVLLLHSGLPAGVGNLDQYQGGVRFGAYGSMQEDLSWNHSEGKFHSILYQGVQQADGYREQSALKKKTISYTADWNLTKHQWSLLGWYTDLYYQTPGGITLAQMQANPRWSRQAAGALPSAVTQQTAIYNQTGFLGIKDQWKIDETSIVQTFVSLHHTCFENPFITNYEFRNETNTASGITWEKRFLPSKLQWITGVEWLNNHAVIEDRGNRKGLADTLQFIDQIFANQWTGYSKVTKDLGDQWHVDAGISLNQQQFRYSRTSDPRPVVNVRNTAMVAAPRFTLSHDLNNHIVVYGMASFGFSPPSAAEIRPSDGNYYGELQSEMGWNYELGCKGFGLNDRLKFDLSWYHFLLQNAIVRRNNTAGAEYFVNAGSARQSGIEASVNYQFVKKTTGWIRLAECSVNYSGQPYRFVDYRQLNTDYSGNAMTGVPSRILALHLNLESTQHWNLHAGLQAISSIPLTDANDVYADPYQLLQLKLERLVRIKKTKCKFFAGVDNLLDQTYSLGNDINAAGKRYYNPASPRNFFGGIFLQFNNVKQ